MNPSITVQTKEQLQSALSWVQSMLDKGLNGGPVVIDLGRVKRSIDQNKLLWHILSDVASQKTWPLDGGRQLAPEHWKLLFMSAYRQEVNAVVMGINAEPVNLSLSTSKLSKAEFSELVELIYAQGTHWDVRWTDRALAAYDELGINRG